MEMHQKHLRRNLLVLYFRLNYRTRYISLKISQKSKQIIIGVWLSRRVGHHYFLSHLICLRTLLILFWKKTSIEMLSSRKVLYFGNVVWTEYVTKASL